jgi:hypothetical protein
MWIACGLDAPETGTGTDNRLLLSVCTTDPVPDNTPNLTDVTWVSSSRWKKYVINLGEPTALADYPSLGVDANGIYIAVNCLVNGAFSKIKIVALPIGPFKNGTAGTVQPSDTQNRFDFTPVNGEFAVQPVTSFDSVPVGNIAWFISKAAPSTTPSYRPGKTSYGQLKWDGVRFQKQSWFDSSLSLATPDTISYFDIPSMSDPSALQAPQLPNLGNSAPIPLSLGTHVMSAVLRNNLIYTCQHVGFNQQGGYSGTADRSGVIWAKYAINSTPTPPTLVHTTPNPTVKRIWDNAATSPHWYYFPTAMVNSTGDILVGFSGSSTTEHVGGFYFGERSSGTAMSRPVIVQAGRNYFDTAGGSYKWGDFSGTSLDPNDSQTFWTFQEYAETSTDLFPSFWGNWLCSIKLGP